MLVNKYDYTPINRETVDGKRHYCLPDGSKVPSVTTILDRTKPEEKRQALANWKKAVGEKRTLIDRQAPSLNLKDSLGKYIALYDIKSKYTVVVFWDHGCGHCKKAMPILSDLYDKKLFEIKRGFLVVYGTPSLFQSNLVFK